MVQNWSTLQCSKQNTEQCGYDHAPMTRGRMRAQFPLPHGPAPLGYLGGWVGGPKSQGGIGGAATRRVRARHFLGHFLIRSCNPRFLHCPFPVADMGNAPFHKFFVLFFSFLPILDVAYLNCHPRSPFSTIFTRFPSLFSPHHEDKVKQGGDVAFCDGSRKGTSRASHAGYSVWFAPGGQHNMELPLMTNRVLRVRS